jgi:hypothetical protein
MNASHPLLPVYYLFIFKIRSMSIQERIASPTPPFFVKLRNWGLILAAVAGAVLTTPVVLPAIVVKVAGYLAVAGGVASAVSQAVTQVELEQ